MKVKDLRTEYMIEPLGLGNPNPRLSWIDEDVEKQKGFELYLTINGETLPVIRKETDTMHYDMIEQLHSRDQVSWAVRIFDDKGNYSDFSETHFEMGLLNQADFVAQWISGDYTANGKDRYPVDCFRRQFKADRTVKARIYASACGLYELKLNGVRVSDSILTPGFTDYRKRIQYQTYDVTGLISEDNVLTAELADGWYRGSIGAKGRTNTYGKITRLYVQLELTDESGRVTVICSDSSFDWSNDGPIRFADLKDGEKVDFNLVPSYRGKARPVPFKANLQSSDNYPVREMEVFTPAEKFMSATGKQVFRLPYNIAGYISLSLRAARGTEVNLVMGEMLDDNNDVTLKNIQCRHKGKLSPLQQITIICREGINEYKSKYYFGGFRYISVDADIDVECDMIRGIALYTAMEETACFHCSSELINIFYENTLRSLKGNHIDIPTDCPTRERMGWTGDSQIFFNTASYLVNYATFARKHINDLFDRQWANGRLAQIVPFSNEDWFMWVMNGSVGWADAGVLIPYRYWQKYGDDRLMKDNLDNIIRYGHFMVSRIGKWGGPYAKPLKLSAEGKKNAVNCGQSYGEWAEPNDVKAFVWYDFAQPHPEESTAYTAWILSLIADICHRYGREKEEKLFRERSERTKKAYQEMVSTPEFTLDTDHQAKLVRPLYMNLLTEKQAEFAKKRLIKALDNYGWRLGTGFLSTPFILKVLEEQDVEAAYRLLENEEMPGWLFMAKNSTTTIWEGWEGTHSQAGIASLNHYSKGAMVEWLMADMCGINVSGENSFLLKPVPGGHVTSAKASYESVYGPISSEWTREENKVRYVFEIPANTVAEVRLPDEKEFTVGPGMHEYVRSTDI